MAVSPLKRAGEIWSRLPGAKAPGYDPPVAEEAVKIRLCSGCVELGAVPRSTISQSTGSQSLGGRRWVGPAECRSLLCGSLVIAAGLVNAGLRQRLCV